MPPISQYAESRNPVSFTHSDLLRILGRELRHVYAADIPEALPQVLSDLVEGLGGREPGCTPPAMPAGPESPNAPFLAAGMLRAA